MPGLDYRCYPPPERFRRRHGAAHVRHWLVRGNEEPIPATLSLELRVPDGADAAVCALIETEIERLGALVDADRRIGSAWWDIGAGSVCSEVDLAGIHAMLRQSFAAYPPAQTRVVLPEPLPETLLGASLDRLLRRLDTRALWLRIGALDAPQATGPGAGTAARLRDGDPRLEGLEFVCRRGDRATLPPPGTVTRWLALAPEHVILRDADSPANGGGPAHERALTALAATIVSHGYVELGFEEYARTDSALAAAFRSGRLHWTVGGFATEAEGDRLGIGPGAITRVGDCCAVNARTPREYADALAGGGLPIVAGHEPTADDRLRRTAIFTLATDGRIDFEALSARIGVDTRAWFARDRARLAPLEAAGLVEIGEHSVALRLGARRWLRLACAAFDNRLPDEEYARLVAASGATAPG